ncbi:MAG TPA: ATP-binding protein [Nostocaceae cyanobacterium]|nr:ATP-binding protein [Nostocaceae cyanobacterium]
MIPKRLDDITEAELQSLVDNSVEESRTIEYKSQLPGNSDGDKKEFLADVSAFANTAGGDLIYGIAEDKDNKPVSLDGLEIENIDKTIRRLEDIIIHGLEPRIPLPEFKLVSLANSKQVLIIRINKSWNSPHRVSFQHYDKFYGRGANRKYLLSVDELRTAFNLSELTSERMKNFRVNRITNIIAGDTPVQLYIDKSPIISLHLIPVTSFNFSHIYDLNKVDSYKELLLTISSENSRQCKYNMDGLLYYNVIGNQAYSYVQFLRNGIIESVWKQLNLSKESENLLDSNRIELELIKVLSSYLNFLKKIETEPPIFIFLTIMGVKEHYIFVSRQYHLFKKFQDNIDRDILWIPEVIIDNYEVEASKILKPCFDLMWNAGGFKGSLNYNELGEWKPQR